MLSISFSDKKPLLFVNNSVVPAQVEEHRGKFHVTSWRADVALLGSNKLSDIPPLLDRFAARQKDDRWVIRAELLRRDDEQWWGYTRANPNNLKWAQPWSVTDYGYAASAIASATDWPFRFEVTGRGVHEFHHELAGDDRTLHAIFQTIFTNIARFGRVVEEALRAKQEAHSVIAQFSFPPDVRTACEQYLLHFIDFLRDIGIEANAELQDSAAGVLFSVTPADRTEALDKIRTALEVYLRLPGAEISGISRDVGEQVAFNKLQMNIHHLKAQLAAADAKAIYLEAAVEAQRYTIGTLKLLVPDDVKLLTATPAHVNPREDREEVLDGILAITKFKKEGFEVNLPELYRRLRSFFRRQ